MDSKSIRSLAYIAVVLLLASLLAWAGSRGGLLAETPFGALPVFVLCAVLAFAIQWVAFIPAYKLQTEHFYDLIGSLTYLSVVACALLLSGSTDLRSWLLSVLVAVWAIRLGGFLFVRISKDGSDSRFDAIKPVFFRFLTAWTIQGLWVFVTCSSALAAITSDATQVMGWVGFTGLLLWILGFGLEVVADFQKRVFRREQLGKKVFIQSGLWAYSRHPNYLGEILLWLGISLIALPVLSGWQLVALISPVFVTLLLTRISGIPMLEASADERWQGQANYEAYKQNTPVLVPRFSKPKLAEVGE